MVENIISIDPAIIKDSPEKVIAILDEKLQDQINKFNDLSRIGTVITSVMELDRILPVVMESALAMIKGEVGEIVLFSPDGTNNTSVCWGISKKVTSVLMNKNGQNIWDYIKESGGNIKIDDLSSDPEWSMTKKGANISSLVAVPLSSQNRVIGAAVIANKIDEPFFTDDDVFSLEILGRFAAVAVINSELHAEALEKQKLEANLNMAHQIQNTLMPEKIIDFGNLKIYAQNTMAMQVGGDFYDVIQVSPNKYVIAIADVCNKGFSAALMMTATRSLVRAYVNEPIDLSALARNVNLQLSKDAARLEGMFVTSMLVYVDFDENIIKSVNAGHPPGFIWSPGGEIEKMKTGGPFLGQFEEFQYKEESFPLTPGTRFFLYTDGVFECVDKNGKMFGISGVENFLRINEDAEPEILMTSMLEILKQYTSDPERLDDTTFVLAHVRNL